MRQYFNKPQKHPATLLRQGVFLHTLIHLFSAFSAVFIYPSRGIGAVGHPAHQILHLRDFFHHKRLKHVADFNVVEPFQTHAALVSLCDLSDIILKAFE